MPEFAVSLARARRAGEHNDTAVTNKAKAK